MQVPLCCKLKLSKVKCPEREAYFLENVSFTFENKREPWRGVNREMGNFVSWVALPGLYPK